ncbi:unnamed protein product [Chrysodeixis includens]|uniref:Uncharacterized protein n=1 Tax=Chrysodeixis includens TaxID=689277 RepID=A0A9P0FT74_CHRIL|nr:unnamed protein product [Chrysodeixis includens]
MSNKVSTSKISFDRCTKTSRGSSHKSEKSYKSTLKKVVTSKKITSNCAESKSCSSGVLSTKKCSPKPKKTTKSDSTVTRKGQNNVVDYCKKCGDDKPQQTQEEISSILNTMNIRSVKNDNLVKAEKKPSKSVQQYYKNENFYMSGDSGQDTSGDNKKPSLDTIREVSELQSFTDLRDTTDESIFQIYSDSDDDVTCVNPTNEENIKKLKEFRLKNYFECHSAKSRIKSKGSVTSLNDHKCVYRFYLNDRLFPVPLNTDHNNKVRCVECHLPMDIKKETSSEKINGTIQAKVKLGTTDPQDMILLLPVKDSLIIEERRKETRANDEFVYFGIVKLSADGNSMFNRTLPENSLALKYQKGYQEHQEDNRYNYKKIKEDDVIII